MLFRSDVERGEFVGDPVVQSKGFHGPEGTIDAVSSLIWDALNHTSRADIQDIDKLRHEVSDLVRRFVQKRTNLRPLVLPTIVQV